MIEFKEFPKIPQFRNIKKDLQYLSDKMSLFSFIFEGTIKRMIFLGTFIDAEIQIKGQSLRASLTPYENFNIGDNLFIHIPSERCRVVT